MDIHIDLCYIKGMPTRFPFADWFPYYTSGTFEPAPWWRSVGNPALGDLRRVDGIRIKRTPGGSQVLGIGVPTVYPNGPGAVMRRLDREHPAARPALRVGQVWLDVHGVSAMITRQDDHPSLATDPESILVFGPGGPWAPTVGSRWWAIREEQELEAADVEAAPVLHITPAARATALLTRLRDPEVLYHLILQLADHRIVGPWERGRELGWHRSRPGEGVIMALVTPRVVAGSIEPLWVVQRFGEPPVEYPTAQAALTTVDEALKFAGHTLVGGLPTELRSPAVHDTNRDDAEED